MNKLIIFDCDGTLVDSEAIAARVFPAVWATMGLQMTTDEFISNFVGISNDAESVKNILAPLPPHAKAVADKAFAEELARNLQPVHGTLKLLAQLSCQACVASNSSVEYLQRTLRATGLAEFFGERIFSAHQVARPKPAPDLFLHAAQVLGFQAEQCLVVEDSVPGVKAAQAAGMKVVGYTAGLHFNAAVTNRLLEAKADFYCDNALELEQLIRNFTLNP